MPRRILTLTLIACFSLSACGVKGNLETAPPLWGDKSKPDKSSNAPDASKKSTDIDNATQG